MWSSYEFQCTSKSLRCTITNGSKFVETAAWLIEWLSSLALSGTIYPGDLSHNLGDNVFHHETGHVPPHSVSSTEVLRQWVMVHCSSPTWFSRDSQTREVICQYGGMIFRLYQHQALVHQKKCILQCTTPFKGRFSGFVHNDQVVT